MVGVAACCSRVLSCHNLEDIWQYLMIIILMVSKHDCVLGIALGGDVLYSMVLNSRERRIH